MENTIVENTIAENTIAENTIAENTIAENTIAENTIAQNNVKKNNIMEKRVLFANRSEEEIQDFLKAVPAGAYTVDTASTGYDVGILLKRNTYGVVVIDMFLKGYDGEQIIKYMNQAHPDTVCIVYTYNLTRGQLMFLLSNRNVSRIFLSPANFAGELLPALEDAYDTYELNVAHKNYEKNMDKRIVKEEKDMLEKNSMIEHGKKRILQFMTFSERLITESAQMSGAIAPYERDEIVQHEKHYLEQAETILDLPCVSLEDVQERLEQEFAGVHNCKEFFFMSNLHDSAEYDTSVFSTIYMALWVLLRQYWDISRGNGANIQIYAKGNATLKVMLHLELPVGIWDRSNEEMERLGVRRQIAESAVEAMVSYCDRQVMGNEIRYEIRIEL